MPHISHKLADRTIAALIVLLLIYLPATSGAVGVAPTVVASLLSLAALALFAFLGTVSTPRGIAPLRAHLWLLVALGGVLAVAAVQLLPLPHGWLQGIRPTQAALFEKLGVGEGPGRISHYPFHSALGMAQLALVCIAFVLGAFWVRRRSQVHLLLLTSVGVATVVSVFGILQAFSGDTMPLFQFLPSPGHGRARGPFVNPDHFAGHLELAAPIAISYLFFSPRALGGGRRGGEEASRRGRIALVLLAFALLCAGVVQSFSRMGILCLVASLALWVFLLRSGRRPALLWLGLGLLLAGGLGLLQGVGPGWKRISSLEQSGEVSQRIVAWKMAIGVIQDYPVLGSGLRTFQDVSPLYQPAGTRGWYGEAHNDYLNVVSDLGGVGAALLICAGLLWWRRVRAGWKAVSSEDRPLLAGCIAALFALMLHETVDFNLQIPGNGFLFALIAGLAISIPRLSEGPPLPEREGSSPGRRAMVFAAVVVTLFASGWGLLRLLRSEILYRGGGADRLARAEALDPLRWDIPYARGRLLEDEGRTEEALEAFLEAARRNPLSGAAHYKAGVQEERLGRREEAESRFRRAILVAPNNGDLAFRVASYRIDWWHAGAKADWDLAGLADILGEFRRAGLLDPRLCDPALSRLGSIFAGPDRLRLARPETAAGHRALGLLLMQKGKWKESVEEVEQWSILASRPSRPQALLRLGEARARSGDWEGASSAFAAGARESRSRLDFLEQVFRRIHATGNVVSGIPLWRLLGAEWPELGSHMKLFEARSYRLARRPDEAVPLLEALAGGPRGAEASYELSLIHGEAGAPIAAELQVRRAIALRPRRALYRHHLSLVLEGQGKIKEALSAAEKAVWLEPEESRYRDRVSKLVEILIDSK